MMFGLSTLFSGPYALLARVAVWAIGIAVIAAGGAYAMHHWDAGEIAEQKTAYAQLQAAHADADKVRADQYAAGLKAEQDKRIALESQFSDLQQQHQKELDDAKTENDRLRTCMRDGTCGLRLNAVCQPGAAQAPGVPQAAAGAGTGNGVVARLTEDAERNYFALRDGIAKLRSIAGACQDTLKAERNPAPPASATGGSP